MGTRTSSLPSTYTFLEAGNEAPPFVDCPFAPMRSSLTSFPSFVFPFECAISRLL